MFLIYCIYIFLNQTLPFCTPVISVCPTAEHTKRDGKLASAQNCVQGPLYRTVHITWSSCKKLS